MNNFKVTENGFSKKNISFFGNKFLTGNGYFGIRGTMEEYRKEHMPCVNMAGIYDRVGDSWRESVNAPNPLYTYIVVDNERYALPEKEPASHIQELDFSGGIHSRKTVWETPEGNISVSCERFADMADQHIIAMKYTVKTDFDADVEIYTGIDGDVWDINGPHFARLSLGERGDIIFAEGVTGEKGIAVEVSEIVILDFAVGIKVVQAEKQILRKLSFNAEHGREYSIEKIALVRSDADDNPCGSDIKALSYDERKNEHIKAWSEIWDISGFEIDGDAEAEHALNYSIYHLNCIAPRNMKAKSIPARGLSGQVYKGAVFWDTEMFMIDYYIHTDPAIARTLLEYRNQTLSGAKIKAAQYGLDGAYYAWESQEGGYEGCSDFNVIDVFTKRPMRTHFRDKQYHVSAAVVYAFMKYINATGDYSVLRGGLETIIECAGMYRSLLIKKVDGGNYEIRDVVGPDEYHERVDNNAYTNRMVKFVFDTAAELIEYVKVNEREYYDELGQKYNLSELYKVFKDSANKIYLQQPDESGIIEQFDGYFRLEDISVDEVRSRLIDPKEYWGGAYGVASQTQVIKQADVVTMLSMFPHDYSTEIMRKNWEYYETRTEHGSSLSACMYALLSCHIGDPDSAYELFLKSAKADLLPGSKEWAGLLYIGGTHPAAEGGAWIVAVKGFAGVDISDGVPVCTPSLPKNWNGMRFKLMVNKKLYEISISADGTSVRERKV